jgi:hypothetical protein
VITDSLSCVSRKQATARNPSQVSLVAALHTPHTFATRLATGEAGRGSARCIPQIREAENDAYYGFGTFLCNGRDARTLDVCRLLAPFVCMHDEKENMLEAICKRRPS